MTDEQTKAHIERMEFAGGMVAEFLRSEPGRTFMSFLEFSFSPGQTAFRESDGFNACAAAFRDGNFAVIKFLANLRDGHH